MVQFVGLPVHSCSLSWALLS